MIPAIASENRKFFSTRIWWILLLCMVAYVAFVVALIAVVIHFAEGVGAPQGTIGTPYSLPASMAYVFPATIGALAITSEYRHQTLTPTFLATPRRGIVLGAKLIGAVPIGLVLGVMASLTALAVGGGTLGLLGDDTSLGLASSWRDLVLGALAMAMWTLIGLSFGALVRSQVAAIVILLVFSQVVEPILRMVPMGVPAMSHVVKFLPGAAGEALAGGGQVYGVGSVEGVVGLPAWGGALTMAAYVAVFAVVGYVVSMRRDVT
ncbi:MAG: hypothetical protein LBH48_00210 [Bifidobacteriaceae bacterium]|jgi:hypothetical protein|nr:hypothetical protein [Bifidobacteriaceae bacterium]